MKTLLIVIAILSSFQAHARVGKKLSVVRGPIEYELCTAGAVDVYADDMNEVSFEALPAERVIPVQSFSGPREKIKTVDGDRRVFIAVRFSEASEDEESSGWVEKRHVKLVEDCDLPGRMAAPVPGATTVSSLVSQVPTATTALEQADCCVFPTTQRPTTSYLEGMREFGWRRPRGRVHAACDLYRPLGDPVVAIADGTVIVGPVRFYQGTYEIEILHAGGVIARYGEVIGKAAPGIKAGAPVKAGQVIGYIGKTTAVPWPMLHFEMYAGTRQGPLSERKSKGFERRADLLNPTTYLLQWEKKNFGESFAD